jgi:hypothetical protein
MPRPSARIGSRRARRIIELSADHGLTPTAIAGAVGCTVDAARDVLSGRTYRKLSRSFPIAAAATLPPEQVELILERRLDLVTAHRVYGVEHQARLGKRRARPTRKVRT